VLKRKSVVSSFDIEGDLVKLAQVDAGETKKLLRLVAMRADSAKRDDLVKVIRRLSDEYRIAGTEIIVNLPRSKVTVKNLKLPSVKNSEIEGMVILQSAKQLPFTPDNLVSSYKIQGRDENGYSDVLTVIAHRKIIDEMLSLFKAAGLDVERLSMSSEAHFLWYSQKKLAGGDRCTCLVDVGRDIAELNIVRGGYIDFSRSITLSAHKGKDGLVEEVRRTILSYTKVNPKAPGVSRLVLTGRRSIINNEAPALKGALGMTTIYSDTLKSWPMVERAKVPNAKELSEESFSAVLCAGFNLDKLETNLIPQEVRSRKITGIVKESLYITVALILGLTVGASGIVAKKYIDRKRAVVSLNKEIEAIKPKVERLTKLRGITSVIKAQKRMERSGVDVIRELYANIPPAISISILDFEDGRSCTMRGMSGNLSDVFKFNSILEESPYFENVKVRYATKRRTGKKELTDFEIVCQLTQ